MKVAIFTETYLPTINGVVTHVKTLKEGLERLGHKVLIVTADSSVKRHTTSDDVMYCPAVRLKKIYNYDIASPISVDRLKLIKEFNPDIIHIHNEFGIGMSGIMISKFLKVPLVYTLHTMYDDYIYYVANKHFCKFVTSASHQYARVLASAASAITGPSKKVEEYFKNCGVKKQVSVIPNSVEIDKFRRDLVSKEKIAEIKGSFGFTDEDVIMCFCGRMGQEKNVETLLKFWSEKVKHDDHLKLLLLGDGPELDNYRNLAVTLHIDDTVKFAGRVEHIEIVPYYACCDAYITASLTECHSISMLEGMSMGLPVLMLKDELNASQIIDGVNGHLYSDADEMYGFLKGFTEMPREELRAFGDRTRNSIVTSSQEGLANSILPIYESIIEQNKRKVIFRKVQKTTRKKIKRESLKKIQTTKRKVK